MLVMWCRSSVASASIGVAEHHCTGVSALAAALSIAFAALSIAFAALSIAFWHAGAVVAPLTNSSTQLQFWFMKSVSSRARRFCTGSERES